jgi:hypothetical protein
VEKMYGTKKEVKAATGDSDWLLGKHLREGDYEAVRDGKLVKVIWRSVLDYHGRLPRAQYGAAPLPCSPQARTKDTA